MNNKLSTIVNIKLYFSVLKICTFKLISNLLVGGSHGAKRGSLYIQKMKHIAEVVFTRYKYPQAQPYKNREHKT